MRLSTLADVTRKWAQPYGIGVVETGGWQGRGYDLDSPDIALRHWTAGPATGEFPSLDVLINGRSDLAGPLCNLGQSRVQPGSLDEIYVIAAGKANHAGEGSWNGVSGNYRSLGLEIEWSGPNESFSRERKLVSEVAMLALMEFCGPNPNDACEHREYAPSRKIDTNLDGNQLRSVIANGEPSWVPDTEPELEMPVSYICVGDTDPDQRWWLCDGMTKRYLNHPDEAASLVFLGQAIWSDTGGPFPLNWKGYLEKVPVVYGSRYALDPNLPDDGEDPEDPVGAVDVTQDSVDRIVEGVKGIYWTGYVEAAEEEDRDR